MTQIAFIWYHIKVAFKFIKFSFNVIKVFAFMVSGFKSLPISFDLLQNKTGSVRIYHCICLKIVGEYMVIYRYKNENFFSPLPLELRLMLLQFIRQTGFLGRMAH